MGAVHSLGYTGALAETYSTYLGGGRSTCCSLLQRVLMNGNWTLSSIVYHWQFVIPHQEQYILFLFAPALYQDSGVFWQVASLLRFLWLAWLLCRRALQQCRRLRLTQTQRILCFHSFPWTVCSYLLFVFALRSCRHLMNQLWSVCGPFYTPLRKQVHGDHDFAGQWGEQANKIERAMYVHFDM